eukprot:Awhi_evm1s8852
MIGHYDCTTFIDLMYLRRLRTKADRQALKRIYQEIFLNDEAAVSAEIQEKVQSLETYHPHFLITPNFVQFGLAVLPRQSETIASSKARSELLFSSSPSIAAVAKCIELNWMPICVGLSG